MKKPVSRDEMKIVVIGGGTGSFTLLSELKNHSEEIVAIVNMVDDGGSTGVLRDELGVLPAGDVRQCLVALSDTQDLRELFNYRFDTGTFEGHSFGNLFLTVLEKTKGDFAEAVHTASEVLDIHGEVVPATLDDVRLKMEWPETSIELKGERVIDAEHFKYDPRRAKLTVVPNPTVNPRAISAICDADIVLIAPGDLYTSLGPVLVIDGITEALQSTDAKVIYVCNLVTKQGQTQGFKVSDHVAEIERLAGGAVLDAVIYNTAIPDARILDRYAQEEAYLVEVDSDNVPAQIEQIGGDYLGAMAAAEDHDVLPVTRSLIRHDATAVIGAALRWGDKRNSEESAE